ncbi:flagellar M-ring protein FliF [Melghiribacillus thermohalophilus]|uniref:Flagellar M-ring protein n=2 Tax=Melghiribacillus thermohalophilus TaxID=1324956 RepID=A0A4R3NDR6_9BACI|nr:flagellar basal-body MS-ring/collar protein FliF [Melghiribacillus thermohalophilus]TCT26775.1 flagellar M-ring protein FliF [Melghiribacillus thermohalophilus]
MNGKIKAYMQKTTEFWKGRTLAQKSLIAGGTAGAILLIVLISLFAAKPEMVPLYENLTPKEAGQLTEELNSRGIQYDLSNGGTTILVPEQNADQLLVELAAQGLPNSGNIDYSFFSQNVSWGMTDEEREIIELDALQTELANLMKSIDGINDANVMINKPQDPIFIGEQTGEASASIVIHTDYGYQFRPEQIRALYQLVSKSVPNLPTDNIVIMNQNFEYFDLENSDNFIVGNTYSNQREIKNDIEREIQREVQRLLGTMIGNDKVVVSVTADVDFTQENRTEELVSPIDTENMEGLPVSVERITETYQGYNAQSFAPVGTGDEEVPNYPADDGTGESEYEMMKETINNEFNRVRKNIVESPYKIRDLGIQVAVDNTKPGANGEIEYLTAQEQETVRESISSILNSIVQTSISKDYETVNPEEKVSIVFQEFQGKPGLQQSPVSGIPTWAYIAGGILLLAVILLIVLLLRNRRNQAEDTLEETEEISTVDIPLLDDETEENEAAMRRKQLERMAREKPEEFAKLLRSWMAED